MNAHRSHSVLHRVLVVIGVVAMGLVIAVASPAIRDTQPPRVDIAMPEQHPFLPVSAGTVPRNADAFDPGFIVSDYNFFNSGAMTEDQVQEFLLSLPCAPKDESPCLRDYAEDTTTQPAQEPGHCARYEGESGESAARIIAKVAVACGISPRVLLVLLQKEQGLLTRPDARGYLRATGYACPDTADCDQKYFGFFNQVYHAAWQFRQYTEFPDRRYMIGATAVPFNPAADCGATEVPVLNQATANLYNYTPYQPNEAALSNLGGEGDSCSAYGNLNFWRFYSQWFGDPTSAPFPTVFGPCANLAGGQPCTAPRPVGAGAS